MKEGLERKHIINLKQRTKYKAAVAILSFILMLSAFTAVYFTVISIRDYRQMREYKKIHDTINDIGGFGSAYSKMTELKSVSQSIHNETEKLLIKAEFKKLMNKELNDKIKIIDEDITELRENDIKNDYALLKAEYDSVNEKYTSLKKQYTALIDKYESFIRQD